MTNFKRIGVFLLTLVLGAWLLLSIGITFIADLLPPQNIFDWLGIVFWGSIIVFFSLLFLVALPVSFSSNSLNFKNDLRAWLLVGYVVVSILLTAGRLDKYPFYRWQHWLNSAWALEAAETTRHDFISLDVENESTYWVLTDHGSSYKAIRYQGGARQSWDLNQLRVERTWKISGYKGSSPLLWSSEGIWKRMVWGWQLTRYQPSLSLDMAEIPFFATGEIAWVISDGKFLQINAISGQVSEIPLPAAARQAGLKPKSMRQAPNGLLAILAWNRDEERIYVYSPAKKWQLQDYPVPANPTYSIIDFFLDQNHAIWLLLENQPGQVWLVQRLRPDGTSFLTYLPGDLSNQKIEDIDEILVDSQGRLWITGAAQKQFIAVFTPIRDALAIPMAHYTPNNSNYLPASRPGSPRLLEDGKILVLGSASIVSFQSRVDHLPDPLPDWVEFIFGLPLQGLALGLQFILLIIQLVAKKPLSQPA